MMLVLRNTTRMILMGKSKKTSNFDEVSQSKELWIQIDDDIRFIVMFKEGFWYEGIRYKNRPEVLVKIEEDMETIYLSNAISCFKIACRLEKREDINFSDREVSLCYSKELGHNLGIQAGEEEYYEEDNIHAYPIELIRIKKEKWYELAKFFEHASSLWLNLTEFREWLGK